jgi:MFS family permease
VINIVLLILSVTHGISAADKGWISSAVLVGALFGQVGFGLIADKVPYPPPTRSPSPLLLAFSSLSEQKR